MYEKPEAELKPIDLKAATEYMTLKLKDYQLRAEIMVVVREAVAEC
jgi:hypothetical protein